jgi:hypothetical protein
VTSRRDAAMSEVVTAAATMDVDQRFESGKDIG